MLSVAMDGSANHRQATAESKVCLTHRQKYILYA